MKYEETKLNENIKKALNELGFINQTKIQKETIDLILEKKNVVAMSSTGSGKTAAFMLPIINNIDVTKKLTQALVITPTRELAIQIVQETRKFCKYMQGINSVAIYGGQDLKSQAINLRRGVKIVVATPGRALDLISKKILKLQSVSTVVIDEADEMLSMGFYKEVEKILNNINKNAQKLLFSATIDNRVKDIVNKNIKDSVYIECKDNSSLLVDNIKQIAIDVKEKMKNECVYRILKKENAKNSIIFCNTKKKTEELYKFLFYRKVKLEMLNSDIRQEDREKILKKLKQGRLDTIVVTDVLARGIDIENLELVINYDIPLENEYYVHRVGRTARKGNEGVAYTLYVGKQKERIKEIEEYTKTNMIYEDVPIDKKTKEDEIVYFPLSKRGLYVVTLSLGKSDGIKAKDIVGAIESLTGIKSENIGLIQVNEKNSTVEVQKEYLNEITSAFSNGKIKEKCVHIVK